jgi:acyl-CoA thioester hydrolase
LKGYRFVHPVEVRFRDLDAVGHVNNTVYLTYMESARIEYWAAVTGRRDFRDIGMILARTEVDYRGQVGLPASLEVGVRCASLRRSSFVLEFRIEERGSGRLVAEAKKVLVRYDFPKGAVVPLEDDLKARLRAQDPEAVQE